MNRERPAFNQAIEDALGCVISAASFVEASIVIENSRDTTDSAISIYSSPAPGAKSFRWMLTYALAKTTGYPCCSKAAIPHKPTSCLLFEVPKLRTTTKLLQKPRSLTTLFQLDTGAPVVKSRCCDATVRS